MFNSLDVTNELYIDYMCYIVSCNIIVPANPQYLCYSERTILIIPKHDAVGSCPSVQTLHGVT